MDDPYRTPKQRELLIGLLCQLAHEAGEKGSSMDRGTILSAVDQIRQDASAIDQWRSDHNSCRDELSQARRLFVEIRDNASDALACTVAAEFLEGDTETTRLPKRIAPSFSTFVIHKAPSGAISELHNYLKSKLRCNEPILRHEIREIVEALDKRTGRLPDEDASP